MTTYPIIKNPHYIDLQKTRVGLTLVSENGVESKAEFVIPEGGKTGVNPIWDRILTEFDEKKMRADRNALETRMMRDREFNVKKQKAQIESEKMKMLFDQKMKCFQYPFVKNATNEEKSAVRRCPDLLTLGIVINFLSMKYIQDNNFSILEFVDNIEEQMDELENK